MDTPYITSDSRKAAYEYLQRLKRYERSLEWIAHKYGLSRSLIHKNVQYVLEYESAIVIAEALSLHPERRWQVIFNNAKDMANGNHDTHK